MDILDKIISAKREEVKRRKIAIPVQDLEKSPFFERKMPSFHQSLLKPFPSIIGEFKRKSPSRGDINPGAAIQKVVMGYQDAGIDAVSVLTDEEFFGGTNADLMEAASVLKLPVLRKDFIVDEYQVVESKAIGASAILLIASALSKREVEILSGIASSLGMDTLLEVHDMADMAKRSLNIKIVGVNNRNLRTFEVDLDNVDELFRCLPKACLKVAESGIQSHKDVVTLYQKGFDAFLIGENFMRSEDPGIRATHFVNDLKTAMQ